MKFICWAVFLFDSFGHREQLSLRSRSFCCSMLDFSGQKILSRLRLRHHWALTLKIYLWISSSRSIWWGQCWCCDRKLLTWSRCKDKRPPPTQLRRVDDCSNNCRLRREHCEDEEVTFSLVFKGNWNSKSSTPKTSVFQEHFNRHSRCQTRYFSYSNISTCCQVNSRPLVVKWCININELHIFNEYENI